MKKILCIALSLIMISINVFAISSSELSEYGQRTVSSKYTYVAPVQDGIITPGEYGISFADVVYMDSDAVKVSEGAKSSAPEFIRIYTVYDENRVYFALEIKENPHTTGKYKLTAKLGFPEGISSWEANSLAVNEYLRCKYSETNFKNDFWDFREEFTTRLSDSYAQKFDAAGDRLGASRIWNKDENPCALYSVPSSAATNGCTVFEFEMDIHDVVSGTKHWDGKIPNQGFFEFEYSVYSGDSIVGTVSYKTDIENTDAYKDFVKDNGASAASVPHVLKLTKDYVVGDVDSSNSVDARDSAILARHIAGWKGYETLPYTK